MSNGLLAKKLRNTITNSTFSKPGYVQVRYKTREERALKTKKFLVPDSFRPHLKDHNRNPRAVSRSENRQRNAEISQDDAQGLAYHDSISNLSSEIERAVSNAAVKEFGLSTELELQAFCGQTHHPHLSSFLRGYVNPTRMNSQRIQHYWHAITDYLPEDVLTRAEIVSPRGRLQHSSYTRASRPEGGGPAIRGLSANRVNLGWHMFLFTNPITAKSLLWDGTDSKFLPGPATFWKHRLWAGGSINLHEMFQPKVDPGEIYHQVERPVDIRVVGPNQKPEKVFLTVRKSFHKIRGRLSPARYNVHGVIESLKAKPLYNKSNVQTDGPVFEEDYTLCFLHDPPDLSKGAGSRVVLPPLQPKFSHTFTPDRHLLFCWSALSYNAHLIHLDSAFAQKEYNAKDLIVHGPLTLILIMEWFQREITKYAIQRELPRFHLRSIDYKNLAPLFVNEPMTLCTKPTTFQTPGTLADSWEVWVQKDLGEGLHTMAFKGTIKLRIEQSPRDEKKFGPTKLHNEFSQPPPEEDSEFASPFF